jgi:hypothetical protein
MIPPTPPFYHLVEASSDNIGKRASQYARQQAEEYLPTPSYQAWEYSSSIEEKRAIYRFMITVKPGQPFPAGEATVGFVDVIIYLGGKKL